MKTFIMFGGLEDFALRGVFLTLTANLILRADLHASDHMRSGSRA